MKILILGHKGMLGHMVKQQLDLVVGIEVCTIKERYPNWDKSIFNDVDFIVNCIGSIPQKTNNFDINWKIPIWLENNVNCKIIHPSTDCEIDNDSYGLSKKKASEFIKNVGTKTKMIQTSIIGPEINSTASLLEWFLSQEGEIFGYTKAMWNGNTTLEWSKWCLNLINNWDDYQKLSILQSNTVSKYELLNLIKEIYQKDIIIQKKELGKDKTLKGNIKTKDIKHQLIELKNTKWK